MNFEATKSITHFLGVSLLLGLCMLSLPSDTVATPVTQQPDQAATALQQGRRLLKRGKSDQALGQLQTALNLYTAAKNNRGIAAAHNEFGDLYLRQGQYNVALDHYQKAFEGFVGAERKQDLVTAAVGVADDRFNANLMLAKIGDVNFRLGRISEASTAYGQMVVKKPEGAASKVGRRFGGLGAIVGSISTGSVSVAAPTSAVTLALEAKKELDEYRNSIVYSSYQLGMGRIAYFNNDLETAKKSFQNALEAAGSSLAGIGNLGQTRRFRAAARTSLGDVALRQAKLKDASKFYTEAAKGAQEDKRLDLTWPAQRGLGRSLWLQAAQEKDPKKAGSMRESAVGNYREAIKTIETLRQGSLHADEARTTFLATTKNVFDEAASALAEMALLAAPAVGSPLEGNALAYAAEAFKITEQARARSLLDLLSESGTAVSEGVPAELLKRKQDNLDRQQEIAELLTGINISTDEPKKKPGELESELDKLQTEFNEIENQIRIASPRYAALTSGQTLALAEVQQKVLDDQTVLLEYSLGTEASYLWAATSKNLTLHKLAPRPTLDKLVTDLRAQLIPSRLQRRIVGIDVAADPTRGLGVASASEEASAFIAASSALYKAAVEPVSSLIAEKRLLVVADGGLNYVPFETLVKTSDSGDYSSVSYLVKTNEIVYAPSASVIGAIRQQGTRGAGRAMLVIADPVFNSNDARAKGAAPSTASAETRGLGIESALTDVAGQGAAATAQAAKMQGLPLARLSGTRAEADQIARLGKAVGAPTDVWLDLDASEANLGARDITKYRVVHIATHGLLNAERPQFTGVVLSLVGNKDDDGFLRTDEVFNLRLGSPLVMLSACETGLGKEKRGEGVMGLTRAFMYAGAPTVGVSLWSVADKSTADLMSDFYKRLLSAPGASSGSSLGVSPSAAMRDAQLAMISAKKYSAPFYWAPFVLVGDWR
ncbi:MAG TPA: CHAT domain-containing tetratricopeptide repeat protein [Pyrinomonadaceae bacterium]|nr:CHAT domain-containing tetratricopeptide repeat protein [Pyrinomonadaceae bacterium]